MKKIHSHLYTYKGFVVELNQNPKYKAYTIARDDWSNYEDENQLTLKDCKAVINANIRADKESN